MTEPVQPTPGQDPAVATPVVAQAPSAQDLTGPWANDLRATFGDSPDVLAKADAFLRGHVQPYVTGLETKAKDLEAAGELIAALKNDPSTTYLNITQQLFGDNGLAAVQQALLAQSQGSPPPEYEAPPQYQQPTEPQSAALPPEVQELIDDRREAKEKEQYEAGVERLKEKDPNVDSDLLAPFVLATDGDFEAAHGQYTAWLAKATPAAPVDPVVPPPPALGSDTQGQPTPPVQESYESLDAALDAHFDEQRAQAPPPVGVS